MGFENIDGMGYNGMEWDEADGMERDKWGGEECIIVFY